MTSISNRNIFLLAFISCISLIGAAYYFEYVLYLDPCPLCMMQRIAVLLVGLVALVGFFVKTDGAHVIVSVLMGLAAIFGISVAGRHIWIQNLPADQVPTCGPSLEYMVDTLPWAEVLSIMLRGNGNCADLQWSFLGLSMPTWVLLWFVGFVVLSIALIWRIKKSS